jgi:peptide/nickel transport system substrate-binding protein
MDDMNYWQRRNLKISRRRVVVGGSMAVSGAALILAGCGGDDDTSSSKTASAGGSTTAPQGNPSAPAKAPTGKMVVGIPNLGKQDYDPAHDSGTGELYVNHAVGEALAIMGPQNNVYVPGLASSWESPDNLTWIFHLRDGVKCHDGSTLTAEDVKFSLQRYTDPANKPESGARLGQVLDSITTSGNAITLKIKTPILMIPPIAAGEIYPQKAFEAAAGKFGDKPIGAGPFKFVSAEKDSKVVLETFTEGYRKVAPFQTLELRMIPEISTRLASLQAGESDVMLGLSGPAIPTIEGDSKLKINEQPSTSLNHVVFTDLLNKDTYQASPWADVRMRQAVAYAIDLPTIIKKLYFGHGVPVAVPWAVPGLPGVPDLKPRPYDPAKAKALISQAGHDGLKFDIYTYDSGAMGGNSDTAEAVSTYLNAVGFQCQPKKMEIGAFFTSYRDKSWAGSNALTVSVVAGRAGETFSDALNPDASTPYYYSPDFFAAANKIVATSDEKTQQGLIGALSQKLYDDLSNVPLVSQNYLEGLGSRVKAWVPRNLIGYQIGMEYIELK